jgi:hypothetical protein
MTMQSSSHSYRLHVIPRVLFCLILFSLCDIAASAQTFYVDFQGGADSNSGTTVGSAWKTIPGTRNAANTAYLSTSYGGGTISSTSKVTAGTVFMLKPGTSVNSSNGGMVWITSTFYRTDATVENPIRFQAYQGWPGASGTVAFDGTGVTLGGTAGWGLIHVTVGGVTFDGQVTDGITVRNSAWCGISAYASSKVPGVSAKYTRFFNNGTASTTDMTGASNAQFMLHNHTGGETSNCNFDGDGNFINGMLFGESQIAVTGYTVRDCTFSNHRGQSPDDDSGMGIKAFNSQITIIGCTFHNNDKGVDLGEYSGNNMSILYKIINCTSYNNTMYGFACNGPGTNPYGGTVDFYFINCIAYDNTVAGFVAYSGPFNANIIHCVAHGNGGGYPTDSANFEMWGEPNADQPINIRIYNSIGYKPASNHNLAVYTFYKASGHFLTLDSDYNCWRPTSSENFALWDYFGKSGPVDFTYAQGPGSTGTNWYLWYDFAATPSAYGNGHFHCDANSVTSEPPFADAANHNYDPTAGFPGANLSGMPWYIPEMGLDRRGQARSWWQMGPYEASGAIPAGPAAPTGLRLR